jgi:NAD+ kinase
VSASPKKPTVLILADFKKPGVAHAVSVAEGRLNGRANVRKLDITRKIEDQRVRASWALVLGGDGAILAAARRIAKSGVPLLGVNLGRLGFLAEINPDALGETIDTLLKSHPKPAERMMLRAEVRRGKRLIRRCAAVNDIVLARAAFSRIIEMRLIIDGEKVNTFAADGMIVSTPIGSTAYSLAAGGPIVAPETGAIVISSICPHTLSNRPLVVDAASVIDVEVWSDRASFAMTVDGQVMVPLRNGDRVRIRRNKWPLKLIKISGRSFFETLRAKLNWEGTNQNA